MSSYGEGDSGQWTIMTGGGTIQLLVRILYIGFLKQIKWVFVLIDMVDHKLVKLYSLIQVC